MKARALSVTPAEAAPYSELIGEGPALLRVDAIHPVRSADAYAPIVGRTAAARTCFVEPGLESDAPCTDVPRGFLHVQERKMRVIKLPIDLTPVGTAPGKYLSRTMTAQGRPQSVPFHFHEMEAVRPGGQIALRGQVARELQPAGLATAGLCHHPGDES